MSFPKANAGDPLRIPARVYNFLLEMAEDYQSTRGNSPPGTIGGFPANFARLRNDTAAALDWFDVVGLGDVLIDPGDNLSGFLRQPTFAGVAPDLDKHLGSWGVVLQPLRVASGGAPGAIGSAVIAGAVPVGITVPSGSGSGAGPTWADMQSQGLVFAEIQETPGYETLLAADTSGSARILWAEDEDTSGWRWAIVRIGSRSGGAGVWDWEDVDLDGSGSGDGFPDPTEPSTIYLATPHGGTLTTIPPPRNNQPALIGLVNLTAMSGVMLSSGGNLLFPGGVSSLVAVPNNGFFLTWRPNEAKWRVLGGGAPGTGTVPCKINPQGNSGSGSGSDDDTFDYYDATIWAYSNTGTARYSTGVNVWLFDFMQVGHGLTVGKTYEAVPTGLSIAQNGDTRPVYRAVGGWLSQAACVGGQIENTTH